MQIEAAKVRRLYLDVANKIEELIKSGEIRPGERLPSERNLAVNFDVSRPTIREAMIALEIAGLVEIKTGSGIYVTGQQAVNELQLSDEGPGPFEVLETRLLIEPEAAALAAARIDENQLAELKQALEEMDMADAEGKEQADNRFHCLIAEASENSALISVVNWLWTLRNDSPISELFHRRVRQEGVHPSIGEHRRIYNAIRARDPLRAREAMRTHIANAIETVTELLEEGRDA